ncbi:MULTISPECIES: hypothetical protein [unclassified Butyricimonas]|mgnify:CR=1 FL=1|jgi:hypothetical protein|uniref:hypothetical protein n=1 Tax=unclassified Butyricimonas TaxID=2637652 RepID=UPI000B3A72F2|nr:MULTISPECIES: hypothetical protein [unclassified Butyricimonas]OUN67035.1 hypothetical protein B5G13_02020 [Butyricimonas sp. An62]
MDKCAVGGRKNEVGLWAGLSKKLFFKFPPPFGVLPLLILDLMIVDFRFPPHKADASKFPTFNFWFLSFNLYLSLAEVELKYILSSE